MVSVTVNRGTGYDGRGLYGISTTYHRLMISDPTQCCHGLIPNGSAAAQYESGQESWCARQHCRAQYYQQYRRGMEGGRVSAGFDRRCSDAHRD